MKLFSALLAAALLTSAAAAVTIGGPAGPGPAPAPGGTPGTPPPPPPPNGGAQHQMDEKLMAFFVGEWKDETKYQGSVTQLQVVYRTDGSFSGTVVYTQNGMSGTYPVLGTYVVQAITDKRFVLTTYPQGGVQVSAELQVIDQNTLFNPQANYYAYRVVP